MGCINWAWKIQGLKSNEKLLLCAIADRADKESGVCVSPIVRISRDVGGWSRQQTNRVLKRLQGYGLVKVDLRYPGTDDPSRMFTCVITTDSEVWRPKEGEGRSKPKSYYVNIVKFDQDLRIALLKALKDSGQYSFFETWMAGIHVIEVRKDRLTFRVPDAEFSRQIWSKRDLVIDAAKRIIPSIQRIRFVWDQKQKQQKPQQK